MSKFISINSSAGVLFSNCNFSSVVASYNFIELRMVTNLTINGCIFSEIFTTNSFFFWTAKTAIIIENSKFSNLSIQNNNQSSLNSFFRVGYFLNLSSSNFTSNILNDSSVFLIQNDDSSIQTLVNISNNVTFESNYGFFPSSNGIILVNGPNISVFCSNNVTFYKNYVTQSLIQISNTLSQIIINDMQLNLNSALEQISFNLVKNINFDTFKCFSSNLLVDSSINVESFISGNCLTITNYVSFLLKNCKFEGNFAVSTMTGILLVHDSNSKLLGETIFSGNLSNFQCLNNVVNATKALLIYSGNCIVLYNQGSLSIDNSTFSSNTINLDLSAQLSGNPCLISHNTENDLSIMSSVFQGNLAYTQCSCLNFDGNNLIIVDSIFAENIAGIPNGGSFLLTSEGGSLNIGAVNITFDNVTISNSSALKAAGMFIHNRNSKPSQNFYANRLILRNNDGFQTSGVEMDASLLLGNFSFINCEISGNSVEFYGVFSTFYYSTLTLSFLACNITENSGLSAGAAFSLCHFGGSVFFNQTTFSKNVLTESVFIGGPAFFVYGFVTTTCIYVKDCLFIENYCSLKGGAIQVAYGLLFLQDSVFINNYAPIGGAISMNVFCPGQISNVVFKDHLNINQGGALHFADFSSLALNNATFINCQARQGGGIFVQGSKMVQNYANLQFIGMQAGEGAAIWVQNPGSPLNNIINITIQDSSSDYSIITLESANINLKNVTLFNNTGRNLILTKTMLFSQDWLTDMHNCPSVGSQGCFALIQQGSNISMVNVALQNIVSQFIEDLISMTSSEISLLNVTIMNYTGSSSTTALLKGTDSSILVKLSNFRNMKNGILEAINSELDIENVSFENITANSDYGVIYFSLGSTFLLSNANFSLITGSTGGCITLIGSTSTKDVQYEITNILVENSFSDSGTVIYVQGQTLSILNSTFQNNRAKVSGGCIYFGCSTTNGEGFTMKSCNFLNNSAQQGGAFHSTQCIPNYDSHSKFINNSAIYGNKFSAFPIKLTLQINGTLMNCNADPSSCIIKTGVTTGQVIPALTIAILDYYGQKMTLLDDLGFINLDNSDSFSIPDLSNLTIQNDAAFSGVGTQKLENGIFNFTEAIVLSTPPSYVVLKVKTDLIPTFYQNMLSINSSFDKLDPQTNNYYFVFPVEIRICVSGEIYLANTTECLLCPKFYYSFFPTDKACLKCPMTATCEGGTQFIVDPGYWRASLTSDDVYQCNIMADACLGGIDSECLNGYTGPICGSCTYNAVDKFFKKGTYFCEPCGNVWIYILTAIVVVFLIFVLMFFLIATRKGSNNENYVLVKMLMSHIQTVSFLTNIKISFPTSLQKFSLAQAPASNFDSIVFTVDCFKDQIGLSNFDTKLILSVAFPAFITISVILFYVVYGAVKRKNQTTTKGNISKALVIIGCFFQATFINFYIRNLCCDQIAGVSYLTDNLDQVCWDESFTYAAAFIIFPNLTFWMLLFPLFFLAFMIIHRKELDMEKYTYITRYFKAGYQQKFFFWEFVHILRQSIVILITTFLRTNAAVAVYILFLFLFFFLILQVYFMPFEDSSDYKFNFLEISSLNACLISYYAALFYLRVTRENARTTLLIIILLFNGFFFYLWVRCYMRFLKKKIRTIIQSGLRAFQNSKLRSQMSSKGSHNSISVGQGITIVKRGTMKKK